MRFQGLGWKVRLRKKNVSYFFTVAKELVRGNALKPGSELYYYLIELKGRFAILLFLDGKERPKESFI